MDCLRRLLSKYPARPFIPPPERQMLVQARYNILRAFTSVPPTKLCKCWSASREKSRRGCWLENWGKMWKIPYFCPVPFYKVYFYCDNINIYLLTQKTEFTHSEEISSLLILIDFWGWSSIQTNSMNSTIEFSNTHKFVYPP